MPAPKQKPAAVTAGIKGRGTGLKDNSTTLTIEDWYQLTFALGAFTVATENEAECYPGNPKIEASAKDVQRLAVTWEDYAAAGQSFGCAPPPEMKEHYDWVLDRSLAVVDIKRWLREKGIPTYVTRDGKMTQITFPTN